MADLLGKVFGGAKSSETPVPTADSDFADFAEAADPSPASYAATPGALNNFVGLPSATGRPYTKWYNVHERYSLSDFKAEGAILAVATLIFVLHIVGSRLNRGKARKWFASHSPALRSEFALVGFGKAPTATVGDDAAGSNDTSGLKEKSLFEFATYGTGRQNVAFVDVKLTLAKRFNPLSWVAESVLSFLFDSFEPPRDSMEAIAYPFDGKETLIVPGVPGAAELATKGAKSTYDGFVWAIVNKDQMKKLRDDRYDLSITFTKDHSKLPVWLSVMSESAEITDLLLTPELAKACEQAGDLLEYLIISDQPIDKPRTLDETQPRKRIFLAYRLPSDNNYEPLVPLFSYFLRLPDVLADKAHFRPEVLRKVRGVREELIAQIKKADEAEKAEERALERDKAKKAKRDAELNALDAKAQKKYLERERDRELRKSQKRGTVRG